KKKSKRKSPQVDTYGLEDVEAGKVKHGEEFSEATKLKQKTSRVSSMIVSHDGHGESEHRSGQKGETRNDKDLAQASKKKKKKKSKRKSPQADIDGLEDVEAGKVKHGEEFSEATTLKQKTAKISSEIVNDADARSLDPSPKAAQDTTSFSTEIEDVRVVDTNATEANHNIGISFGTMDEAEIEEAKLDDDAILEVTLDPRKSQESSNRSWDHSTSEVEVDCETDSFDAKTVPSEQEESQVKLARSAEGHDRDGEIEYVIQAQETSFVELVPANEEVVTVDEQEAQVQLVPAVEEHGHDDNGPSESELSELIDDRDSDSTDQHAKDASFQVDSNKAFPQSSEKVLGSDNSVASGKAASQDEDTSAGLRKQVEQLQEQLYQQQLKTQMLEESVAIGKSKQSNESNAETTLYKGMVEDLQEDYDALFEKHQEHIEENAQRSGLMKKLEKEALEFERVIKEKTDRIQALEQKLSEQSEDGQILLELKCKNERLQKMSIVRSVENKNKFAISKPAKSRLFRLQLPEHAFKIPTKHFKNKGFSFKRKTKAGSSVRDVDEGVYNDAMSLPSSISEEDINEPFRDEASERKEQGGATGGKSMFKKFRQSISVGKKLKGNKGEGISLSSDDESLDGPKKPKWGKEKSIPEEERSVDLSNDFLMDLDSQFEATQDRLGEGKRKSKKKKSRKSSLEAMMDEEPNEGGSKAKKKKKTRKSTLGTAETQPDAVEDLADGKKRKKKKQPVQLEVFDDEYGDANQENAVEVGPSEEGIKRKKKKKKPKPNAALGGSIRTGGASQDGGEGEMKRKKKKKVKTALGDSTHGGGSQDGGEGGVKPKKKKKAKSDLGTAESAHGGASLDGFEGESKPKKRKTKKRPTEIAASAIENTKNAGKEKPKLKKKKSKRQSELNPSVLDGLDLVLDELGDVTKNDPTTSFQAFDAIDGEDEAKKQNPSGAIAPSNFGNEKLMWAGFTRIAVDQPLPFHLIQDDNGAILIQELDSTFQAATGAQAGQRVVELQSKDVAAYQDLQELQRVNQETLEISVVLLKSPGGSATMEIAYANTQSHIDNDSVAGVGGVEQEQGQVLVDPDLYDFETDTESEGAILEGFQDDPQHGDMVFENKSNESDESSFESWVSDQSEKEKAVGELASPTIQAPIQKAPYDNDQSSVESDLWESDTLEKEGGAGEVAEASRLEPVLSLSKEQYGNDQSSVESDLLESAASEKETPKLEEDAKKASFETTPASPNPPNGIDESQKRKGAVNQGEETMGRLVAPKSSLSMMRQEDNKSDSLSNETSEKWEKTTESIGETNSTEVLHQTVPEPDNSETNRMGDADTEKADKSSETGADAVALVVASEMGEDEKEHNPELKTEPLHASDSESESDRDAGDGDGDMGKTSLQAGKYDAVNEATEDLDADIGGVPMDSGNDPDQDDNKQEPKSLDATIPVTGKGSEDKSSSSKAPNRVSLQGQDDISVSEGDAAVIESPDMVEKDGKESGDRISSQPEKNDAIDEATEGIGADTGSVAMDSGDEPNQDQPAPRSLGPVTDKYSEGSNSESPSRVSSLIQGNISVAEGSAAVIESPNTEEKDDMAKEKTTSGDDTCELGSKDSKAEGEKGGSLFSNFKRLFGSETQGSDETKEFAKGLAGGKDDSIDDQHDKTKEETQLLITTDYQADKDNAQEVSKDDENGDKSLDHSEADETTRGKTDENREMSSRDENDENIDEHGPESNIDESSNTKSQVSSEEKQENALFSNVKKFFAGNEAEDIEGKPRDKAELSGEVESQEEHPSPGEADPPSQQHLGAVATVVVEKEMQSESSSPAQLLHGAVTAVMTSNNLGGEGGIHAAGASDDDGLSKTSDAVDLEYKVTQSDDDRKDVSSSPAQFLRGAVTAVMASKIFGGDKIDNEPSSPAQLLRGAVTAVMTSNNLGGEQAEDAEANIASDEEPAKSNHSVAAEEEIVAEDVSESAAEPTSLSPNGTGEGATGDETKAEDRQADRLLSSFRSLSEKLLSPNSMRSPSNRKLETEKENEEKMKLMVEHCSSDENEILGGAEMQETLIRQHQEEAAMSTLYVSVLGPNENTEDETGAIDSVASPQPAKAIDQIEPPDASVAVSVVEVSTPKSFGTPTVLSEDFLQIPESTENSGATEEGTSKSFGTPLILPKVFLEIPSDGNADEPSVKERQLKNSPELESRPPIEIVLVDLQKQLYEMHEKLHEQQMKRKKMEEEAATWETKSVEKEDQLVTYKGMYEELQEDYDINLEKYTEQIEQNATLLGLINDMKNAASVQESALTLKADRIRTLEEKVMTLQQSSDTKQLADLKDENAKLRQLVKIQKGSIQAALQGM
ncbi:MAG: hypothetical protein SGBAC_009536, partial [Bacillariaceae sp.]